MYPKIVLLALSANQDTVVRSLHITNDLANVKYSM